MAITHDGATIDRCRSRRTGSFRCYAIVNWSPTPCAGLRMRAAKCMTKFMCNHINGPTVSRHSIKCTIDHAHPKSIGFVTKRIHVCHPSTNIPCSQKMSNVAIEIGTPVCLERGQDSAWGGQSSIGVSAGPDKYFRDLDCNVFISIQRSDLVKKSGNIIGDCRQVTSLALI